MFPWMSIFFLTPPVIEDTLQLATFPGEIWVEGERCTWASAALAHCVTLVMAPFHRRPNSGLPPMGLPDTAVGLFPRPGDMRRGLSRYQSSSNPLGMEYPLHWSWATVGIMTSKLRVVNGDTIQEPWPTSIHLTVENVVDTLILGPGGEVFTWSGHLHSYQNDRPYSERPRGGFLGYLSSLPSCLLQNRCYPEDVTTFTPEWDSIPTVVVNPEDDVAISDTIVYQASYYAGYDRIRAESAGGEDWMAIGFPATVGSPIALFPAGEYGNQALLGYFEGGNCRHQGRIAWWKRDTRPDTPPYDTLYHVNCQWTMDFENQYATPYATMVLYKLLKFLKETAVQKGRDSTQPDTIRVLDVNDISLPWGGEFDIYADWSTPHSAHRTGRTVDIPYRIIRVTPDGSFVQHLEGQKKVIKNGSISS